MSGYASDLTLNVKLCPRNSRGVLDLSGATAMSLTTASRVWKPLPPGNVKLNGQPYSSWPSVTTGDVTLSWSHRNRAQQGVQAQLVTQDTVGSYSIEGTLTVEVLIAGLIKRTWSGLTGTSQAYTLAQRLTDDPDLAKTTVFRITPLKGTLVGTTRTTPGFVMG